MESILPTQKVKIAMAGRNKDKLQEVKRGLSSHFSHATQLDILVGDVSDQKSIDEMVSKTKVVISAAGPYAKVGSPIVDACARLGKGYVDITGESHWVRKMIDKYDETAKQTGATLISFSGFDSIPSDIGTYFAVKEFKEKFGTTAKSVTATVYKAKSAGVSGGTLASGINMIDELGAIETLKMTLDPYFLNPQDKKFGPDAKGDRFSWFYDDLFGKWQAYFVMAMVNTRVVRRSAALMGYEYGNYSYSETMSVPNALLGLFVTISFGISNIWLLFPPVRSVVKMLLNRFLPPGTGPAKDVCKDAKRSNFTFKFHVKGDGHEMLTKFYAPGDGGYWTTCVFAACSGLLLLDPSQLPRTGGHLTPAAAFQDKLVEKLKEQGCEFAVEKAL